MTNGSVTNQLGTETRNSKKQQTQNKCKNNRNE